MQRYSTFLIMDEELLVLEILGGEQPAVRSLHSQMTMPVFLIGGFK